MTAAVFLLLACFHVSVLGQSAEIAKVSASGDTIRWEITVPYSASTITVSGPSCGVIRKEFKEGSAPTFTAYDRNGNKLPDGQYQYELRLTPVLSAETVKGLAAARQKSGGQEADPDCQLRASQPSYPLVQSGAFTMVRGSIVVAGETEDGRSAMKTGARKGGVAQVRSTQPRASTIQDGVMMLAAHAVENDPPLISWKTLAALPFPAEPMPDQVIPDDLIVQGSLCVGFDCVNNESFGFDTIRLKENNTRIKFEDTSVGASRPTTGS